MNCSCTGCKALYEEVVGGTPPHLKDRAEATYEHYRIRLLKKGWGGVYSTAERAYIRAHRPVTDKQQAAYREAGRRGFPANFTQGGDAEAPDLVDVDGGTE